MVFENNQSFKDSLKRSKHFMSIDRKSEISIARYIFKLFTTSEPIKMKHTDETRVAINKSDVNNISK
jgi:hypothetical protein